MARYALGDAEPIIHPNAFVHPDATVIGNVTLAAGVSVWPQAVLRGDNGAITIGARTVVQDRTLVHCTAEHPKHWLRLRIGSPRAHRERNGRQRVSHRGGLGGPARSGHR